MAKAQAGHVLLLTGSAPYLGGPSTWKPLRDAASDLEFRDLDLLDIPPGSGSTAAIKQAIKAAAEGASAIVAHGAVAATVLGAIDDFRHSIPVLLLSPVAITRDSLRLRFLRTLVRGPLGKLIDSYAASKMSKLLKDYDYLRKQLAFVIQEDAITEELLQEAQVRLADARMEAFCAHTSGTLLAVLTPTGAFERFNGLALFGNSSMDRKARKRIPGTVLATAWSAPMIEAPKQVAEYLYTLLLKPTQ